MSPSLRASYEHRYFSASGFLERSGPDSTDRMEAALRVQPFAWLYASAAASQHRPDDPVTGGPERSNVRSEIGASYRGRTVTGGVIRASGALRPGMPIFDSNFVAVTVGSSTGYEVGLSGRIVGPFSFDFRAIDWGEPSTYRPQNETRTEIRVSTSLLDKLPRGTFHLTAAVTHEWQATMQAPDGAGGIVEAQGAGHYGTLLDIRIGAAHIFWYNRNWTGRVYETVPGYLAPRLVQLYGIRWNFWN